VLDEFTQQRLGIAHGLLRNNFHAGSGNEFFKTKTIGVAGLFETVGVRGFSPRLGRDSHFNFPIPSLANHRNSSLCPAVGH